VFTSLPAGYHLTTNSLAFSIQSSPVNCYLPSPTQSFLNSVPVGTHDRIFIFSRLLRVLNWGLFVDKRRGLTTTGHSPSAGATRVGTHSPTLHPLCRALCRLNCCLFSPAPSFSASGLVEICAQDCCSLLDMCVFGSGASSSTREGSVFLCRRYVCCTVVSVRVYPRCHGVQVTTLY
jgi:hypothetical protein